MKNIIYKSIAAVLFLIITGCVSTEVTKLKSSHYPPVHEDAVQVFLNEEDIEGDYEKLALINTKGDATWTKESKILKKAKKEAGELGANAIVLNEMHEPGDGAKIAGAALGVGANRRGKIIAIRLLEDN